MQLTETGGVGLTTPSSFITPMFKLIIGRLACMSSQGMGMQLISKSHGLAWSCALSQSSKDDTVRAIGPTPMFTDSLPSLGAMMPAEGMRPLEHFSPPWLICQL